MSYESPFATRYGSDEMRGIWSEATKRRLWRRIWLAVAEAQAAAGLVSPAQVDDLRASVERLDLARSSQIEAQIDHDLVAELRVYAEQASVGGSILHWGLTSADVTDNADIVRQRAALGLLLTRLRGLLLALAQRIDETADLPIMGYTHLQPAEPTSLGYRLAGYAQDLLGCLESLARLRGQLRGKGVRGAVGTAAPFVELLQGTPVSPEMLEATVLRALGIEAASVSTQTYPRLQDYWLLSSLGGLAAALHHFAMDLRLMQSPAIGVASEPFGDSQVGSSAMPFKRNPIKSEKICSLARVVAAHTSVAWQNAAESMLERTLDDSANRRVVLPEAFLASDEILRTAQEIVEGLQVQPQGIAAALERYGPYAATERILSALVRAGADRQEMHERLRVHARQAWEAEAEGKPGSLLSRLQSDTTLLRYLQPARLAELLDVSSYLGLAPSRARRLAEDVRQRLAPAGTLE
jgi:adenylosuccinate lyase